MNAAGENTDLQSQAAPSRDLRASEEALARIWAEVLRIPRAEHHANFFEIGGDSLKAMEVIARVSEVLHVDLPLIAFFEDPTISHLAGVLSGGRSSSEDALANIWAEVLRLPRVDSDANFFDIGGDSLKAMEVIARVSEVLQVDLPLVAFFEDPTVTHLAAVVDELKPAGTATTITRAKDRHEFPLSYSQQGYWLLEQQNPGTGIYNTPRIFRIRGKVDPAMLERSLNELRRRHEILQVRFIHGVDGPVQVVEPGDALQLAVTDLSTLEAEARKQAAMKLALETVRQPFDLERGPTLRARLVRLAAEDYVLCVAMHHVISDGFTGSIVLDELGAIYDAYAAGEPDPLPDVGLHFTDYAAWERQWMQGPRLEQELEYWRSVLKAAPSSLSLPTDFVPSAATARDECMRSLTIPGETLERLKALAQSNGTTLFTVLSAGLRTLLYRWSGQGDFLLGTIASSRSRSGTERMIGCFVNPLPLGNPVMARQSVFDLLNNEKNAVMDAFAHQDCPFAKIVEAISPERTRSDNPLFNVALVLQNFPVIEFSGRNFQVEFVNFDIRVALLDLRFVALETGAGLQLGCEYKSALFSEETIDALLHGYAEVLRACATNPASPVDDIALPEPLVRQAAAARQRDHVPTVAITASFTAEPVAESLSFLLSELDMQYRVTFAPYQQVFQQLLDPTSVVRAADGFAVVLLRFEDWMHGETGTDAEQKEKLEQVADELIAALRAAQSGPTPVILCFCPASRAIDEKPGWREWLHSLEEKVAAAFGAGTSVNVIRSQEILDLYPVEEYEDEYAQRLGNVPYTTDFYSALGTMLVRRMWGIAENRYKVIAMECDQVLWSGYCARNQRVVVDGPHRALQNSLLEQRDAGMLLCLCSKNREEDVWAAFEGNAEFPLQRDDFIASAVSLEANTENLGSLARELGFELDSFIFLSSDPDQCAAVEAAFPGVLTLQAPAEPDEIPTWLKHVWAFDRRSAGQ
jgi:acyl carrier protein